MDRARLNLQLAPDVADMLTELAGGERKRSEYLNDLLRTTYAAKGVNVDIRTMDVEALRLTVLGLAGRVQTVEGELVRTQSHLAALIAQVQSAKSV